MPCTYYTDAETIDMLQIANTNLKLDLNKTTDLLCNLAMSFPAIVSSHTEFRNWWEQHKRMDKKRVESELEQARLKVKELELQLERK